MPGPQDSPRQSVPLEAAPTDGSGDLAAATDATPDRSLVYRQIGGVDLHLHVFAPAAAEVRSPRPAIVFFHGGAWRKGSPSQFFWQSRYLASRGMVAVNVQYRLIGTNATAIAECIDDARAAFRYVRSHAADFAIDPQRIAAGGGSAGGHLAAALAVLPDPTPHPVSAKPDLLVLFNPALFHRLAEQTLTLEHFTRDTPPAIYLLGTNDEMLAYAQDCLAQSRRLGNTAQVHTAAGEGHGFFNRPPWREATMAEVDRFLAGNGYLHGQPELPDQPGARLQRIP